MTGKGPCSSAILILPRIRETLPAMKVIPLLLAASLAAAAQTDVVDLLARGLRDAAAGLAPLPAAEEKKVLDTIRSRLEKHLAFRRDGTATATYRSSSNWHVEWRAFSVRRITPMAVSEADRLNGITRRYLVSLGGDAHRFWRPTATSWSPWHAGGFGYFPPALEVQESGGTLTIRQSDALDKFSPGPGDPVREKTTSKEKNPLPPGMTRGK
jgi:hypothetical protein